MVQGLLENVVTPHRINLTPPPIMSPVHLCSPARLVIKPSRKYRTRKRIQLISPLKSEENPEPLEHSTETVKASLKKQTTVARTRGRPLKSTNTNVPNGRPAKARGITGQHGSQSHKLTEYFDIDKSVIISTEAAIPQKKDVKVVSHKLTEYYPVRRSVRKTSKCVLAEKRRDLEAAVRERREDGLAVTVFEAKGRGVVAQREFCRGDFVLEYEGELVSLTEAREREERYAREPNTGCYMYYFRLGEQQYCIDATAETGRLGRLVNHSRNGNLSTKAIWVDGAPHLVLLAAQDIATGEELTYDYGDRSKESLTHHPWLAL